MPSQEKLAEFVKEALEDGNGTGSGGGNGSPAQREITEGPNQPARARRPAIMFRKEHLDALFGELRRRWQENPEYDRLYRDAHLGSLCSTRAVPWATTSTPG